MTAAPPAPGTTEESGDSAFDANAYRKAVLAPMLASGVVSIEDPFKVLGLDPSVDDVEVLRARLAEVVGFWQRERNSPRYKNVASELVKRRPELETVLYSEERRALARMRVQGTRRAQESARVARIDRLVKAIVARHNGVPRGRLRLLAELAHREGIDPSVLDQRLAAVTILEDGYDAAPLPDTVRLQIRASLDELALRGDRARAVSLWSFLGMTATATQDEVADRHASLVLENQAQAHDRAKTVVSELLAQVKAVLLESGARASYLGVLVGELRERLSDRVLELALIDGELWPADVEQLNREALALGTGLSAEQVRTAVRETATGLGIAVTTGRASEQAVCSSCQRSLGGAATAAPAAAPGIPVAPEAPAGRPSQRGVATPPGTAPAYSAGATVLPGGPARGGATAAPGEPVAAATVGAPQAAEEWRQLEREITQRRLVHALARAERLHASSPNVTGPGGHLPQQRVKELARHVAEAADAVTRAHALPDEQREEALYAVLERVADSDEASSALASLPLAPVRGLSTAADGTTFRLSWDAPSSGRTLTYHVLRVHKDRSGARVEHPLGITTRCEAVDADAPRDALVWHEVTATLGTRRSSPAVTQPRPVTADVTHLRAAQGPDGVSLTWTAPGSLDVVVERRRLDEPDAPMRRARARGTRWHDVETEAGATYRYVVRAEVVAGGSVTRTPGCSVDVRLASRDEPAPAPAPMPVMRQAAPTPAPATLDRTDGPVSMSITSVPPGIVVTWEAPPRAEVTIFASQAPLGVTGGAVDPAELSSRARLVGFAVGGGTAFDADPGPAAIITPVISQNGAATLCSPLRHVSLGAITNARVEREGARWMVRFDFPRECDEALLVWRRDRPPVDAADSDDGEILTPATYAARGGWPVPDSDTPTFTHVLVLPVAHLGGEPVFGKGATLRAG